MSDELVPWLRRVIEQDRAQARDLIESEAAAPVWHEMSSGVLVTGPPEHDDTWAGTFSIGDSRITRYIAEHDPRDTVARREAELAVLELHCVEWLDQDLADGDYRTRPVCTRCDDGYWPCRTVRLLARGYRYRGGYRREWRP